jgi:hypothetical protein
MTLTGIRQHRALHFKPPFWAVVLTPASLKVHIRLEEAGVHCTSHLETRPGGNVRD